MGKRGPKPKTDYAGESRVHSIRIRSDLHSLLRAAAAARGKTLSDEIQNRVRRTFIDDEKISEAFGSRQNFWILRVVASAIGRAYNPNQPEADWLKDSFLFDQAIKTIVAVLNAIRPPGPIEEPSDRLNAALANVMPKSAAAGLWKGVQDADPSMPLNEGTRQRHLAALFKAELGEIAARPKIISGTAKEIRRAVAKMDKEAEKTTAVNPSKGRKKGTNK
jgi:hypothetical protein